MGIVSGLSLVILPLLSVAAAADVQVGPVLQSLDGAASISILGADGSHRDAKVDDALKEGDILSTSANVAATIAFEQGAQVLLAAESNVKIGQEAEEPGEPPVPSVEVQEGDIRAIIETYMGVSAAPQPLRASPPPPLKSHRFVIKTKTAIMGVRGTDFVVSAKSDRFSLNTLSGTVEVGPDLKALGSSKVVSVGHGQELAEDGPKPFVSADFLKLFHHKHPQLEALYRKAQMDLLSGTLKAKFTALRAQEEARLKKPDGPDTIEFPGKKKPPQPSGSGH